MAKQLKIKSCRVCLSNGIGARLTDMEGKEIRMFKQLFEIDVTKGQDKHGSAICDPCLRQVWMLRNLKLDVRSADRNFFNPPRGSGSEEDEETVEKELEMEAETEEEESKTKAEVPEPETPVGTLEALTIADSIIDHPVQLPGQFRRRVDSPRNKFTESNITFRRRSKKKPAEVRNFSCSYCHESFNEKTVLVSHILRHVAPQTQKILIRNKTRGQPKKVGTSDASRRFKCNIGNCSKNFEYKYRLKAHQVTHSDTKTFVCHCGYASKWKPNLVKHQKVHSDDKPFLCPCGYASKWGENLKKHQKTCRAM